MIDDPEPGEKRRVEFLGGPNDGETALMLVGRREWRVLTPKLLQDFLAAPHGVELELGTGRCGLYTRSSDTTFTWQGHVG